MFNSESPLTRSVQGRGVNLTGVFHRRTLSSFSTGEGSLTASWGSIPLQGEIPGRKEVMVLGLPRAGAPLHPSHSSVLHMTQLTPPESDGLDTSTMKLCFLIHLADSPQHRQRFLVSPSTPSVTPSHPRRHSQVCYVHNQILSLLPCQPLSPTHVCASDTGFRT